LGNPPKNGENVRKMLGNPPGKLTDIDPGNHPFFMEKLVFQAR
jgi:hypothetical protein